MFILPVHYCTWGCEEQVYNLKVGWRGGIKNQIKWDNQGRKNLERSKVTPLQFLHKVEESFREKSSALTGELSDGVRGKEGFD